MFLGDSFSLVGCFLIVKGIQQRLSLNQYPAETLLVLHVLEKGPNTAGNGSSCFYLVVQLCLTLLRPMNYGPAGSSGHGTSQAGILERAAISSSRGASQPGIRTHVS